MSHTPRSRTPSRAGTPVAVPSPSRLAPPLVQPSPSVSPYRVYSQAPSVLQTPTSISPPRSDMTHGTHEGADSSASSILNTELSEGMLIQDPEAEVDTTDGEQATASGHVESHAGDEESKKSLRDQLRRTLNKKESSSDLVHRSRRRRGKTVDMQELSHSPVDEYPPRQYFVLTDAGKPVFISRQRDGDSDNFTSTIGIMQALVSVFIDDGDKLRCINAGSTRITFLLRSPLYYACVSSWGEPESVTRFHLEYLHLQILSVVSAEQLRRMFERRTNFDLRRLLSGAEPFLYSLLARLEWDLAMTSSSLNCLRLDPVLRKSVADTLVPTSKIKDILYVILLAQERVITLVRPKKHSIHPSDLHILVNTIHSPSIVNNSAAASWLPVCLPKFDQAAFVNAYVTFLHRDSGGATPTPRSSIDGAAESGPQEEGSSRPDNSTAPEETPVAEKTSPEVGLICVSGSADFEAVRNWCDTVTQRLEQDGLLAAISTAITRRETEYSVSDLGVPGLRHFMYKSRPHVQVTMPLFEDPYDDTNEKRRCASRPSRNLTLLIFLLLRLIILYQTLYDAIHAKSGQESTLKLQYIRTERESVMGWITQPFELYLSLSPRLPKSAAVGAANAVARWVQKEEKRLFLRDAPVF
ncbi:trafficking protein Mon1-domain-containing protein [Amylocystis lapponica]|nr:trafficking protein Mon1-domain-containing protein [Amylocystis lapponica]